MGSGNEIVGISGCHMRHNILQTSFLWYIICGTARRWQNYGRCYGYVYAVYSFDGVVVLALLIICTCAYIKRVPKLKGFFLSEKKGLFGVFYKASVIGIRLHWAVAMTCLLTAMYILFLR